MDNITCSLVGEEADAQCGGWRDLGPSLRRSAPTEGGISLWFDGDVEAALRELAAKEKDCCSFLDLAVTAEGGDVRLDVTTELTEARPVIDALGELVGAVDR
jgi:hypothetical protein